MSLQHASMRTDRHLSSLVPRRGGGGGESAWYTLFSHALNRHMATVFVRVRTYTGDVIKLPRSVLVGALLE